MTNPQRVIVISRDDGSQGAFTVVRAEVDGGVSGDYMIATNLVGTPGELDEIRAQSTRRREAIEVTRAGVS